MLPENIISILQEPLPVHQRKGPGGTYKYVKGEDVVKQLNKAFGHSWSSKALFYQEQHKQILVLVELSVVYNNDFIVHQAFGSSPIARHNKGDGDVVDIGNSYKSAFTTALKKAAEQLGVGKSDEEESESHQSTPPKNYPRPAQNQVQPSPPPKPAPVPVESKSTPTAPVSNAASYVEEKPISDLQKSVVRRLLKLRGVTETDLLSKADSGGKNSIDELTNLEGTKAIQYLNTVRSKQ